MEVETAVRTRRRGCRGPEVTLVAAAAPVGPHQAVPRDPGSISTFPLFSLSVRKVAGSTASSSGLLLAYFLGSLY